MARKKTTSRVRRLPVKSARPPKRARGRIPRGKLEMVITHLEMTSRPVRPHAPHRGEKLALMRAEQPTASFYRFLYNTVGGPWLWYERRRMDDEQLLSIIRDSRVEIYVLYVGGVPAGYSELDCREDDEVELAFFGLLPEFIGRGLGHYLLDWSVDQAWSKRPSRVWVHTCNFDHPKAVVVYQQAGFVPYHQEVEIIDDPRRKGAMPKGMEFGEA